MTTKSVLKKAFVNTIQWSGPRDRNMTRNATSMVRGNLKLSFKVDTLYTAGQRSAFACFTTASTTALTAGDQGFLAVMRFMGSGLQVESIQTVQADTAGSILELSTNGWD
jgi:hypothetical protein